MRAKFWIDRLKASIDLVGVNDRSRSTLLRRDLTTEEDIARRVRYLSHLVVERDRLFRR
jgi:hypothetical protein